MFEKLLIKFLICFVLILANNFYFFSADLSKKNNISIFPEEYEGAIKNPIMGLTIRSFVIKGDLDKRDEWNSLMHDYIAWDWLEENENDGIEKIQETCDKLWKDVEKYNIKVVPRVFLYYPLYQDKPQKDKWDFHGKHWPSDMKEDDYESEQFINRIKKLIIKLGKCWDNDPRVAYVEMGIIGRYGEQLFPLPTYDVQIALGDAFKKSFKNKKITVRCPWEKFKDYKFGVYWDAWQHYTAKGDRDDGIWTLNDLWKSEIIGGEVAYDLKFTDIQPGKTPTDSVVIEKHRYYLIDSIRSLHCTQLHWISDYDRKNPEAVKGAEEIQKTFGYRYVIKSVTYNNIIDIDNKLNLSLKIMNTGSAPFYYNWPVEVSIHDAETKSLIWKKQFNNTDIRKWLPGDNWNKNKKKYDIEPKIYSLDENFEVNIPDGKYILCIAVLDPSVMKPSLRFAIKNYWKGGRHPLGYITKGLNKAVFDIKPLSFDDLKNDDSLNYCKE